MISTRQYLNEAALSVSKLLGLVRGMTNGEIDDIMGNDEAGALAKIAHDLHEYTVQREKDLSFSRQAADRAHRRKAND